MAKYMKVFNHGKNLITLTDVNVPAYVPIELHFKEDGSVTDGPTFAIVLAGPTGSNIFGELSLETLGECLDELGYHILKKTNF